MKKAVAVTLCIFIFLAVVLLVMAIWGYYPLEWRTIVRLGFSALVVIAGVVFAWITYLLFYEQDRRRGKDS